MRPIRVTTETAIPMVFQMELAEAAEAGVEEEVDEGETVGFQEVISGAGESFDGKTMRVSNGVAKGTADLVVVEVVV